jgi:hypothetical protein
VVARHCCRRWSMLLLPWDWAASLIREMKELVMK